MNSIYDILNKLNSIQPAETSAVEQVKSKSKLQESIDTLSQKYVSVNENVSMDQILAKYPREVENFKQGGDLGSDLESALWDYYFNRGDIRNYDADASEWITQQLADELGLDEGNGVSEVAPPGAKAERMIKHIKKGYAKDGKLTPKEKAIAYATAWKAHKAGKVEEAVASLKPLLDAGMTAQQISEGWDDMMAYVQKKGKEEKGTGKFDKKKISTGTVYTRKYDPKTGETDDSENVTAVKRGRGRPKKDSFKSTIDEMVAESYGDHRYMPSGEEVAGKNPEKMTMGDKIKSLGKQALNKIAPDDETLLRDLEKKSIGENDGQDLSYEQDQLRQAIGDDMFAQVKSAVEQGMGITDDMYETLYDYYTESGEMPYGTAKARDGDPVEWVNDRISELFNKMEKGQDMDKDLAEMMRLAGMQAATKVDEDDMEEGNEFSGALAKAKAAGAKEFEVDGKKYPVKEDEEQIDECGPMPTEMPMGELTISGSPEALAAMLKLAGLQAPAMMEQPVEEEKDPRYEASTTPEEEVMPVQVQIKGGNGEVAGEEKPMHKDGAARFSDNPLAMKESIDDLSNMGLDLMKAYESIKIQK